MSRPSLSHQIDPHVVEVRSPSAASVGEVQKLTEWFGALGRTDYRRLSSVGCSLEIFHHYDAVPFEALLIQFKINNVSNTSISWRVLQRCRLSSECFVSISPSKGVVSTQNSSNPIQVCIVLFHQLTVKHLLYIECSLGSTGTIFYLPIGINVRPIATNAHDHRRTDLISPQSQLSSSPISSNSSSILIQTNTKNQSPTNNTQRPQNLQQKYWAIRIPTSDQLSVLATRQGGAVLLCNLYGVEVVMKTWTLGHKDPPPPRFDAELNCFLNLHHPNLVGFVGAWAEPGEAYILLEYVLNGSLNDFFARATDSQKTMKTKTIIALDVARALAYLFSKGKVHMDLNPRNILIGEDFHAKLSGFDALQDVQPETFEITKHINNHHSRTNSIENQSKVEMMNQIKENEKEIHGKEAHEPTNTAANFKNAVITGSTPTISNNCYRFGIFLWELYTERSYAEIEPMLTREIPLEFPHDMEVHYPDLIQLMFHCLDPIPSNRPGIIHIVSELTNIVDTPEPRNDFGMNLSMNTGLFDHDLSRLPKSLVCLDLCNNTNITAECEDYLPLTLEELRLGNEKVIEQLSDSFVSKLTLPVADTSNEFSEQVEQSKTEDGKKIDDCEESNDGEKSDDCRKSDECKSTAKSTEKSLDTLDTLDNPRSSILLIDGRLKLPNWVLKYLSRKSLEHISTLSLTSLSLANATHLTDEEMKLLPATLNHLDLGENNSISDIGIGYLPRNLKSLTLSTVLLSNESIRLFPKSLTELILPKTMNWATIPSPSSSPRSETSPRAGPTSREIHSPLSPLNVPFEALKPETISHESMEKAEPYSSFLDDKSHQLPPSLTKLVLGNTSRITDATQYPRSLTHLDLGINTTLDDQEMIRLPRNLTYLAIADNSKLTSLCIASLPPNLIHLKISGNSSMGIVDKHPGYPTHLLPQSLTILELPDDNSIENSAIPSLPKSLTSLNLSSNEKLDNDCIPLLPPKLTVLSLSDESQLNEACLPFLPKSIMSLNIQTSSMYIKDLPRTLTSLNLERCRTLSDASISYLPPSLTYLKLSCSRITDIGISHINCPKLTSLHLIDNVYLTDICVPHLPHSLTKLLIDDADLITPACLKWLPRNITYLVLPDTLLFDITDETIRDLPRSITELIMQKNENLTNSAVLRLPRTLTSLDLESNENFTDACLKHLPRGLLHLNLKNSDYLSPNGLSDLPQSLTKVILPDKLATQIQDSHIRHLPRKMTFLDLSLNRNITVNSLNHLPPSLTTVILPPQIASVLSQPMLLPRYLTELSIPTNVELQDSHIKDLPRSLTHLDIYWNNNLTDASIKDLPRSLLYLNLGGSTQLTDACLKDLPMCLIELSIDANCNFTNSGIKSIPRTIETLNLAHAYQLTYECLIYMPSSLTSWSLSPSFLNGIPANYAHLIPKGIRNLQMWGNTQINDDSIPLLPSNLEVLNLASNPKITNYGIPKLPSLLTELNLEENRNLEDSSIAYLPRLIKSLNLSSSFRLTDHSAKSFPPGLTVLDVSCNSQITDAWIKIIPRTLTDLNVSKARLSCACLPFLPPSLTNFEMPAVLISALTTDSISYLPRSLTNLNLWCNTTLPNQAMKLLPRVTSLNLAMNNQITDQGIASLPASITSLNLSSNSKITNACASMFPASLTDLNIASALNIDDAGIPALPRGLKRLIITRARVTDFCIASFPPNLVTLSVLGLSKEPLKKKLPNLRFPD